MAGTKATLTEGPVGKALVGLALPMSLGIVFLIALNLVDTYFVGQLGTKELAAMSFTFPVITLVISVTMGLGVGTTSAVSRAIGAGDERKVRRLTTHAMFLAVLIVALVSTLGLLTQAQIFSALGAEPEILPLLEEYMDIWFAGSVFLVIPMVANGVLRASGDAKTPMYMMMVAAIVNGVLDPILIFGWWGAPALGLAGAALATLAARSVTLAVAIYFLFRRKMLDLHVPTGAELMNSWKSIVSVGVPAAITNALAPVATAVMTALIAREGHEAVAAYGVGSRVEGLLLIAPWGLTAALTPFIGQNWGAHQVDRVGAAIKISNRFVFIWGTCAWLLLLIGGASMGALFTDDPAVIQDVRDYLWIVPLSYGASGIVSVWSAAFNAVDKAVRSTLLSATRSLGLAVPLAYVGAEIEGIHGIFAGIAVATIITAVIASRWGRTLTQPKAKAHEPDEARAFIQGLKPQWRAPLNALLDAIHDAPALEVRPRPINTIGFYARGRELGHVHRNGHVDLHFPLAVGDELISEGKAVHHRHIAEASWVSFRMSEPDDSRHAAALVKLASAMTQVFKGELELDELESTLLTDRLRARIESCARSVAAAGTAAP